MFSGKIVFCVETGICVYYMAFLRFRVNIAYRAKNVYDIDCNGIATRKVQVEKNISKIFKKLKIVFHALYFALSFHNQLVIKP